MIKSIAVDDVQFCASLVLMLLHDLILIGLSNTSLKTYEMSTGSWIAGSWISKSLQILERLWFYGFRLRQEVVPAEPILRTHYGNHGRSTARQTDPLARSNVARISQLPVTVPSIAPSAKRRFPHGECRDFALCLHIILANFSQFASR